MASSSNGQMARRMMVMSDDDDGGGGSGSIVSGVTRGARGRTAPGDTLQGVTHEGKNFLWANLQRIVEKRGRTGKKVTHHPGGVDTRVKAIKSDSDSDSA